MNSSSFGGNVTSPVNPLGTFTEILTKNLIVVLLCIFINYINVSMIHTFSKHQVMIMMCSFKLMGTCDVIVEDVAQEAEQIFSVIPRYILFIHLVVNDTILLFLSCLLHVISYVFFTINVSFCIVLLIFAILSLFNTPLNLACMALECYIAICVPLRHPQICTVKRTYILIGLIWVASSIYILPDLFVLLATEPVEFLHSRVICVRDFVFRSAYILKKQDISDILCLVIVWIILVYSYFRILFAAKAANADAKKARNTILLHGFQLLLCMLTYVQPTLRNFFLYIFPQQLVTIRFVNYIIVQILPRFISPIVYGLRDQTFRKYLKRDLLCKVSISTHPQNVKRNELDVKIH